VPSPAPSGTIVHLLGRVTDEMVAYVAPVTRALVDSGVPQTVILIDDPSARHRLAKFDERVRLVLGDGTLGPLRAPAALVEALFAELQLAPVAAVHAHGLLPCLLSAYAARFRGLPVPLHFSLYGSGVWSSPNRVAAFLLRALSTRRAAPMHRSVDAPSSLPPLASSDPLEPVLEHSVDDVFFCGPRREARRPLVVTASRADDPRGAARFAQLAVLLSEESLGLSFNWVGQADAASIAQLNAAGVGMLEARDDMRRVARLRSAWLYVAGGSGTGFPVCLAEAMAMGLPCVAWDTPQHRALLRPGETGLLCESENELLACIASLVDSAAFRSALGQAARAEALRRFHHSGFGASLLASYRASAFDTLQPVDDSSFTGVTGPALEGRESR